MLIIDELKGKEKKHSPSKPKHQSSHTKKKTDLSKVFKEDLLPLKENAYKCNNFEKKYHDLLSLNEKLKKELITCKVSENLRSKRKTVNDRNSILYEKSMV